MQVNKVAQLVGHNAAIFALAEGMDERHVITGAGDAWVVLWNLDEPDLGKLIAKVERQVFSICFLKKTGKILAGNIDGGVHWIDLNNPEATKNIAHHQKGVFDILAVHDHVFTVGGDGKLSRWSMDEMRALESYHLANQALRCIDYCEGRHELAIGGSDGAIYLLDAGTLELRQVIQQAHGSSVFSIKYAPNGKHLLSGGRDALLNAWDLESGYKKTSSLPAHWYTINSICFSPDGGYFATASRDKTVKIWSANNFGLLKVLEGGRDGGHFNSVNKVLWLSSGLLSCSDDRTVIRWNVE
jgi:WD40 repeat protein